MSKQNATLHAIDINVDNVQDSTSAGIAYIRIPNDFKEFLSLCEKKHGILGFEYTEGENNFGIILRANKKQK